jgi:hypothetical protein
VLPPFVLEILKRHRVQQVKMRLEAVMWQEGDYVFCTSHGTPFAAANLRTMFKDLLKKAGCQIFGSTIYVIVWQRCY